jgi:hypothetical protein
MAPLLRNERPALPKERLPPEKERPPPELIDRPPPLERPPPEKPPPPPRRTCVIIGSAALVATPFEGARAAASAPELTVSPRPPKARRAATAVFFTLYCAMATPPLRRHMAMPATKQKQVQRQALHLPKN